MGHAKEAVEVAKTVVEVAELAWSAAELLHRNNHHNNNDDNNHSKHHQFHDNSLSIVDYQNLCNENKRLKELLEQNLKLLHNVSSSPSFVKDCPPDLHERLVKAVDSKSFLTKLESLRDELKNGTVTEFPFKEPTGEDLEVVEIMINVDQQEPSWWVWVTDSMVQEPTEARSGIDDENYVVVCEELVVDGVANFIARCIMSNPKLQKLTPEQLQKAMTSSLDGINKLERMLSIWHAGRMFYALSTWGLAVAGLYQSRGLLKLAARGVHHTGKLVLKAM